jgi:hypothetical protein
MELVEFASHELYLFVAFMCGLLLGYILGRREDNM